MNPLLAAFYLNNFQELIDDFWQLKYRRSVSILGSEPLRALRGVGLGDRTRLDLMAYQGRIGIRLPSDHEQNFSFLEIQRPDAPHPAIVEMLNTLEIHPYPFELAQLRFRYSHNGELGLWVDCSNQDIKHLLDTRQWLDPLIEQGWMVALGQKGKHVIERDGALKLSDPEPMPWLASYDVNGNALATMSCQHHFSQPGPEANRAILALCFDLLDEFKVATKLRWNEYGAGWGNLSVGLGSRLGPKAWVSEYHPQYHACLSANLAEFLPQATIAIQAAESSPPSPPVDSQQSAEFWLIDPPRPGFGKLLAGLKDHPHPPQWILAIHCHENGLTQDSAILKDSAYQLKGWSLTDNFPATSHVEVVSLWSRG